MLPYFLNPWLLAGALGIGLPILAHLLSRRRYDVVEWGAMQFLNPGRKTRRRLRLEELLLLSLRISMILMLVLAAARPWLPSGWLSGYHSAGSRSIVLVIDGSNSMTRSDGINSLHQNAIRRATEFLSSLSPGDGVALIDARDQPRTILESPLQDLSVVRESLRNLPAPAGAADLQKAAERAIAILSRSSSAAREIVILTDRQRSGWQPDDEGAWNRFDDLITFPAVRPRVWTVDVSSQLVAMPRNIAVGRLQLTRDLTVPNFPLRLRTTIRSSGDAPLQVQLRLLMNGQPLAGRQQHVDVPASGEAAAEFEILIRPEGVHLLSVEAMVPDDPVPADNISHAAVRVSSALPVLLINGQPSLNPAERETFFASIALTTPGNQTPWVQARVVDAQDVRPDDLNAAMVILADVGALPPGIPEELSAYADQGHGVLIACGHQTQPAAFEQLFGATGLVQGVELLRLRDAPLDEADAVQVMGQSLVPGWLNRFSDPSRSFLKARYRRWWLTRLTTVPWQAPAQTAPTAPEDEPIGPEVPAAEDDMPKSAVTPVVLAQLTTGDPLLIQIPRGRGSVTVMTSSLSRSWNDLPAKADFVPFLHEAVFHAAASGARRNVDFGSPLISRQPAADQDPSVVFRFAAPSGLLAEPAFRPARSELELTLSNPLLPGIYELVQVPLSETDASGTAFRQMTVPGAEESAPDALRPAPAKLARPLDRFVVNYDHREDVMTELSADDRARLRVNDRVRFAQSAEDLRLQMYGDESRTELWALLLFLFPCLLIAEALLTRRIVQRGIGAPAMTPAQAASA